jgi:hypothetical protein
MRWFFCYFLLLCIPAAVAGCKGDEKGVNHNKEKPEPARTEKVNPIK